MLEGVCSVRGYNDKEILIARIVATTIYDIKQAVSDMVFIPEVKRISIQALGEETMKTKEGVDLDKKMNELIDSLKTTNKELSKICNAICMK